MATRNLPNPTSSTRAAARAPEGAKRRRREPLLAQIASFVDLFVWLLVLKSFFLPLFIIPTGSMAETLCGAHANHTCSNCGFEYQIGYHSGRPARIACPNCRWTGDSQTRLHAKDGDRIVVHGWPYDLGGRFGPRRWDVVVFRNPNQPDENYIKRLIGLPGETLEIIDGDVFVGDARGASIARKTPQAQDALWLPFYHHDYLPRDRSAYDPRWVALRDGGGWSGLETRVLRFDGPQRDRSELAFTNAGHGDAAFVLDVYGYNGPPDPNSADAVTDVRLAADVSIEAGDGYVELSVSKYEQRFFARLYAEGRVTLEHADANGAGRAAWGEHRLRRPGRRLRLGLGHADYRVAVEVDGRAVLESPPTYGVSRREAVERAVRNEQAGQRVPTLVRIAAERVRASLSRVRIDRDVHYTYVSKQFFPVPGPGWRPPPDVKGRVAAGEALGPYGGFFFDGPGNGVLGNPISLGPREYFMLGDNSPQSADGRAWNELQLGEHLREAQRRGEYHVGTVPADQLIGRAFLVYWPGFLPLTANGPNVLPDLGRVRWIH